MDDDERVAILRAVIPRLWSVYGVSQRKLAPRLNAFSEQMGPFADGLKYVYQHGQLSKLVTHGHVPKPHDEFIGRLWALCENQFPEVLHEEMRRHGGIKAIAGEPLAFELFEFLGAREWVDDVRFNQLRGTYVGFRPCFRDVGEPRRVMVFKLTIGAPATKDEDGPRARFEATMQWTSDDGEERHTDIIDGPAIPYDASRVILFGRLSESESVTLPFIFLIEIGQGDAAPGGTGVLIVGNGVQGEPIAQPVFMQRWKKPIEPGVFDLEELRQIFPGLHGRVRDEMKRDPLS